MSSRYSLVLFFSKRPCLTGEWLLTPYSAYYITCMHRQLANDRKKSAFVKKHMQILHSLLSSQYGGVVDETRLHQEEVLLRTAYAAAKSRLVVKRPTSSPWLGNALEPTNPKPVYVVSGPVNRWDIYVK
jgi:hypothetical protein